MSNRYFFGSQNECVKIISRLIVVIWNYISCEKSLWGNSSLVDLFVLQEKIGIKCLVFTIVKHPQNGRMESKEM